jgi:hypothetical protein
MNYIKYKRIKETFDMTHDNEFQNELQRFLDKLIEEGWDIINYNEHYFTIPEGGAAIPTLSVIVLVGKTSSQIKNVL